MENEQIQNDEDVKSKWILVADATIVILIITIFLVEATK